MRRVRVYRNQTLTCRNVRTRNENRWRRQCLWMEDVSVETRGAFCNWEEVKGSEVGVKGSEVEVKGSEVEVN